MPACACSTRGSGEGSPNYIDCVLFDLRVAGHNREFFNLSLRHQKLIEGISMMGRKGIQIRQMGNLKFK